jgi:hypothetical protein
MLKNQIERVISLDSIKTYFIDVENIKTNSCKYKERQEEMKLRNMRLKDRILKLSLSSMKNLLTSSNTAISEFLHYKREEPRSIWKRC